MEPLTVTVLLTRPEVGEIDIDGVEIVTFAEALMLPLSVAVIVLDPAVSVALFIGMTTLVTNRPLVSSLTGEPKFILSASIAIAPIVNEDRVAAPPMVKFSPVMARYWLGRAVVGDSVMVGVVAPAAGRAWVWPAEREANSNAPAKTNR